MAADCKRNKQEQEEYMERCGISSFAGYGSLAGACFLSVVPLQYSWKQSVRSPRSTGSGNSLNTLSSRKLDAQQHDMLALKKRKKTCGFQHGGQLVRIRLEGIQGGANKEMHSRSDRSPPLGQSKSRCRWFGCTNADCQLLISITNPIYLATLSCHPTQWAEGVSSRHSDSDVRLPQTPIQGCEEGRLS